MTPEKILVARPRIVRRLKKLTGSKYKRRLYKCEKHNLYFPSDEMRKRHVLDPEGGHYIE